MSPVTPSPHALSLAGVDLPAAAPPLVRSEAAAETVVVLSRSRDPRREIDLDACAHDRVPVVVRPSGGGAVVLSRGVVAASVLAAADPRERFQEFYFRRYCAAVAAVLQACGAAGVAMDGVSDLRLGDRKVAGSSLRLWGEKVLFQVSVLVCPDLALMERYLRHPSREPAYRRGRPHREFVTTLAEAAGRTDAERVAALLGGALLAVAR